MLANSAAYCPHIHECEDVPRDYRWSSPRRRLAHYVIVTSLDGSEQIQVDGTDYLIRPGQTYLIQPDVVFDLGSLRGNRPVWIHFDLLYSGGRAEYRRAVDFEEELGERRHLLQPSTREVFDVDLPVLVPKSLSLVFREEVPRIVRRWSEQNQLAVFDATQGLSRLLFAWISQRWRELGLSKPLGVEGRIRYAEQMAARRLGTSLQLADFAELAGYGRTRFSTLYKKVRGTSPAAFLREERIRQARHLLVATETPIREVGAEVGYLEPTVFGRVFRKYLGMSPGEFRERERRRARLKRK